MSVFVGGRGAIQKALRITDRRGQERMTRDKPGVEDHNARSVDRRSGYRIQLLNVLMDERSLQTKARR